MMLRIVVLLGAFWVLPADFFPGPWATEDPELSAIMKEITELTNEQRVNTEKLKIELSVRAQANRELVKLDSEGQRLDADRAAHRANADRLISQWNGKWEGKDHFVLECYDPSGKPDGACLSAIEAHNGWNRRLDAAYSALDAKRQALLDKLKPGDKLDARNQEIARRLSFLRSQLAAARVSVARKDLKNIKNCSERCTGQALTSDALAQCLCNCWDGCRSVGQVPTVEQTGAPVYPEKPRRTAEKAIEEYLSKPLPGPGTLRVIEVPLPSPNFQ